MRRQTEFLSYTVKDKAKGGGVRMQVGKIVILALLVVCIGDVLLLYAEFSRQASERRERADREEEMEGLELRLRELERKIRG